MNHYSIYHSQIPEFIAEISKTSILQRLKSVGMNCGCEYTSIPMFRCLQPYSRLEHSIGTALIVWHFTASREQSVSGLLHDAATPAFSHVVDFLKGDYLKQEVTEKETKKMISESSELQKMLEKYGLRTETVSDYHRYPIADNEPPRLSADRLEYTVGNCINYEICTEERIERFYRDLIVGKNADGESELIFQTPEIALEFARAALSCSEIYISDEDRYAMQMLSELLQLAMSRKILTEKDLYRTEPEVIGIIRSDLETEKAWRRFCALRFVFRTRDSEIVSGRRRILAKKRIIDPFVCGEGRVSEIYPGFACNLKQFLSRGLDYWIHGISEKF